MKHLLVALGSLLFGVAYAADSGISPNAAELAARTARQTAASQLVEVKTRYRGKDQYGRGGSALMQAIVPYTPRDVRARVTGDLDFGVSHRGSATMNVPIWVPPGRAGMQPALSAQYDSAQGSNLMGIGWSLGGVSRITRCMKSGYDDPLAVGPITWSEIDGLCLDGERLVLVRGSAGSSGAVYRTRHDRLSEVTVVGYDELGPQSFQVRFKDHRILFYGQDSSSRTEGQVTSARGQDSSTEPALIQKQGRLEWLVSRMEDRSGNFVAYSYTGSLDRQALQPLLEEINYTGSLSDPTTRRQVVFAYETRQDADEKYVAGMRLSRSVRLASIEMRAPRPDILGLARKYLLEYETAPITRRSRLMTLRECDADPVSASSKVQPLCRQANFQYQNATPGFDDIDTGITDAKFQWVDEKLVAPRLSVGDFNGDGRDDILYTTANRGRRMRLSHGTGFGDERNAVNETGLLDYDGDSRTDVLELNYPESVIYRSQPDMMGGVLQSRLVGIPGGAFERHETDLGLTVHNLTQWSLVEPVDLDSDRRPDLLVHTGRWPWYFEPEFSSDLVGDWAVMWNAGNSSFLAPQSLPIKLRPDHRFIDIDGDGRAEILTRLGSGNLLMAISVSARNNIGALQTALPGQTRFVFLDANGDGLSDVLVDPSPPELIPPPNNVAQKFWLSLGNGFVPRALEFAAANPILSNDLLGPYANKRAIDYYLNGKQQLLVTALTATPGNTLAIVQLGADGAVEAQFLPIVAENASLNDPFEVLDANGDGLDDILLTVRDRLHLFLRRGKKPDLLVSANGTLGTDIQFRYRPLSAQDETSRSDCRYPVGCVYSKLWVVDQLRVDTGLGDGGYRTYNHSFEDGRTDLLGLGFLGFKTHTVEDAALQRTVMTTFDLSPGSDYRYPGIGLPVQIEDVTILEAGVEHRRTATFENASKITDDSIPAPYYPFFVYQKSTSLTERQISTVANTLVSHVVRTFEVDRFGNTTKVEEAWPESSLKLDVSILYQVRPDAWLVDQPHLATTRSTDSSGNTSTRRTAFEYHDSGLLRRLVLEPGADTASGFQALPDQQDGVRTLSTTFDYTPEGLPELVTQTDMTTGETRSIGLVYDSAESMFAVNTSDALNHVVERVMEPSLGVLAKVSDANGVSTQYQYDGFGRLRFVNAPDGSDSQFTYAAPLSGPHLLDLTERTAGHGRRVVTFDSLKRIVLQKSDTRQDGKIVNELTRYDSAGRMIRRSRPYFDGVATAPGTALKYDNLGRLVLATLPDGSTVRSAYEGRVASYFDAAGNQSQITSDTAGRITRTIQFEVPVSTVSPNPPGTGLAFGYGPFNALTTVTGADAYRFDVHVDRLGRAVASLDPDAGTAGTRFNAFGDVIETTRGGTWKIGAEIVGGQKTTYRYDSVGRPVQIQGTDGITQLDWDTAAHGIGLLTRTLSPDSIETQYAYDNLSRLATEFTIVDGQKYAITRFYDNVGRFSALTYPDVPGLSSLTVQTLYSNGGQPVAVQRAGGGPVYWKLKNVDAAEEFGSFQLGNGVQTQISGLPSGVLTSLFSKGPKGVVQDLQYKFEFGRLIGRRDDIAKATETYEYDSSDRLSRWQWQTSTAARAVKWNFAQGTQPRHRSIEQGPGGDLNYSYDTSVAGPHAVVGTELGAYQYDALGRQTGGPGRTIDYTSFDLPKRVNTATAESTFSYDAFQRRVKRVSGAGGSVLSIDRLYDVKTSATDRIHSFHLYAGGSPIADFVVKQQNGSLPEQSVVYMHTDPLGSITALTDGTAGVLAQTGYEPYGAQVQTADAFTTSPSAPQGVSSGFTGQRQESDSGLIDFVGRLYDPKIGRFLTPDPVLADPLTALGRDPYSYVGNNPVAGNDPTGFEGESGPIDAGVMLSSGELPTPETSDPGGAAISGCVQPPFCSTVRGNWQGSSVNAGGDTGDLGSFSSQPFSSTGALPATVGLGLGMTTPSTNQSCGSSPMIMCRQPFYVDPAYAGVARDAAQGHLRREDPIAWLIPISVSARAAAAGSRWLLNATLGTGERLLARGAGKLGGTSAQHLNGAGSTIWTAMGRIHQGFFSRFVKRESTNGGSVILLTGAHGTPEGNLIADAAMHQLDVNTFSRLPGVNVLDVTKLSEPELIKILAGADTVVAGFCNSGVCLLRFMK